eukprot:s843_g8.t1
MAAAEWLNLPPTAAPAPAFLRRRGGPSPQGLSNAAQGSATPALRDVAPLETISKTCLAVLSELTSQASANTA